MRNTEESVQKTNLICIKHIQFFKANCKSKNVHLIDKKQYFLYPLLICHLKF